MTKGSAHVTSCAMKTLTLLGLLFVTFLAPATEAYSGFVNKINSTYFYTEAGSRVAYRIVTSEPEDAVTLSQLSAGDRISGHGVLNPVHRTLIVQSIDFVGLRKLLGPWLTTDGVLHFQDFDTMTVQPLSGQKTPYHYSLTPSENGEWVMFLSDSRRTILATLRFDADNRLTTGRSKKSRALLKIFEANSGKILRTLNLERP